MDMLRDMGGERGLLRGLGTNKKRGLGKKALSKVNDASHHASFSPNMDSDGRPGTGNEPGAGAGASQRHDRHAETTAGDVPKLVVTGPGGEEGGGAPISEASSVVGADDEDGPTYTATLQDRRRVYGENTLPTRKTKSLLELMWLALKDKVLVRSLRALLRLTYIYVGTGSPLHRRGCLPRSRLLPRFRHDSACR